MPTKIHWSIGRPARQSRFEFWKDSLRDESLKRKYRFFLQSMHLLWIIPSELTLRNKKRKQTQLLASTLSISSPASNKSRRSVDLEIIISCDTKNPSSCGSKSYFCPTGPIRFDLDSVWSCIERVLASLWQKAELSLKVSWRAHPWNVLAFHPRHLVDTRIPVHTEVSHQDIEWQPMSRYKKKAFKVRQKIFSRLITKKWVAKIFSHGSNFDSRHSYATS